MVQANLMIEQFAEKGEKSGWNYLSIPAALSNEIKPNCKVSYRVKGSLDKLKFEGIALTPMGGGDFILALRKEILKDLGKRKGALVSLSIEEDKEFKYEIPDDLEICLKDVEGGFEQFLTMPKSHQNYFIRWINEAKTEVTRVKRLAQTVEAMQKRMDYGEMIRHNKGKS